MNQHDMTASEWIQILGFASGILVLAVAIITLSINQSRENKYHKVKQLNKGYRAGYEHGFYDGEEAVVTACGCYRTPTGRDNVTAIPRKENKMTTNMEAMAMAHEAEEWADKAFIRGREYERDRIVNILMKDDTTAKLELILGTFWSTNDDN